MARAAQAPADDGALLIAEIFGSGTPQSPTLLRVRVDNARPTNGRLAVTDEGPTADPAPPRLPALAEIYAAGDHLAPGTAMIFPPLVFMADRPTTGPLPSLELESCVELLRVVIPTAPGILPLHTAGPIVGPN